MKKIILLFLLITFFLLSYSFAYAGAPPTATSCPVCPSGYIWNNSINTCQEKSNPANYKDPTSRVNCSVSGPCCTNAVDGTCSNTGYCSSNPAPVPAPQGVYNCANRDPRCPASSYLNCKDFPNSYLYSCAPPYCVMHNTGGSDESKWTTSCSWANSQQPPLDAQPPLDCNIVGGCTSVGIYNLKCDKGSCDTAIGNIKTTPGGFINDLFTKVLGIVGGIAVLLIIISGYRLMTSRGNPEQVQHAREQLTAAIVGLLFVIFSLVILQVIGVDILRLPGFEE